MGAMVMQMPQMQYIQPPMGQSGQTGVAYQSQPVTYQSQQLSQPPPPPAGNPPKDSDQESMSNIFKDNLTKRYFMSRKPKRFFL